jgi:shikimate dehydrogenase
LKHYGLIGFPLEHSFSKKYFQKKFEKELVEADYELFPIVNLDSLEKLVKEKKLDGFNVTIPFKQRIIPMLNSIDEVAKKIDAVNCVVIENGKLIGFNTDVIGFEQSFFKIPISKKSKALIFGSGGAANAVKHVLREHHLEFMVVSRNDIQGTLMYQDLNEEIFESYNLLINCTPVGMYPNIEDTLPLPFHLIDKKHFAFDMIYNPEKSKFLQFCEGEGARIQNGIEMLEIQAEASYAIWSQKK